MNKKETRFPEESRKENYEAQKMKLTLNLSLAFFSLLTFHDRSFSLTNYQINKICDK